ncbi:uncharacterized protein [Nothobranchius furzeri]|uniref:uncharacterized protein n=1 Tax=Nothobranchius furzeri TaxID=105023 RepID=UPI003904CB04
MDSEVTMQLSSQLQAMQNTFLPMMTNMMNMICNLQKDVEGVKQFMRDSQATRAAAPGLPEKPQNETGMLRVDVFTGSDSQENNNTSKEGDNTSPVVPSVAMLGDEPADDDRSTTTTTAVTEKILLAPLVVRKGSNRPAVEVTVNQRHRCVALLDTGADISLISGALYSSMCEQRGEDISTPTLISGPKDFDEFYGAPSPAAATAEVNISIGGMSFKHFVYITEDMPMPMLLGLDCLQRLDARISGASGQLFARVRQPKPYKPWPDTGGRPSVACLSRGDASSTSPPLSKPPGRPPELLLQIEKVIDHFYDQNLRTHLLAAFSFAQASLGKSAEGRKTYYDKKASHPELDVGDQAWYYIFAPETGNNTATSGKLAKKLLPRWSGPYLITDKISPVMYQIKIANKNKAPVYKWVHRDHIKLHKGPTDLADTNNNNPPTSKGG